ncbi:MAG: hypothetical protein R3254_04775 [Thiomicrorhabdus sp.]|nr:hypothetical protein [Thiomicrorhabdus sp.]
MRKNRSELKSIAKKGSAFHGLKEVAVLSAFLPVAFLSSLSLVFTGATL